MIDFFDNIRSSSYVVFDSGYKQMYDRFNDTFRFVPLNGDIGRFSCKNDLIADPFFSPADLTECCKSAVKLASIQIKHKEMTYIKQE